jgi:hypothetical protein
MTRISHLDRDWPLLVQKLGGAEALEATARETKALQRRRAVRSAVDLLRLVLAYCLGDQGLRSIAGWSSTVGLADLSNVALLQRLRQCGDWLNLLVGQALAHAVPAAGRGRLIRLVDATAVAQAGKKAKKSYEVWRIHSAFDLPAERFTHFELTDQTGAETLDRVPVVKGEIRLADRAFMQPDRIARVREAGADVVIRAGWKGARWLDAQAEPFDLLAAFRTAADNGVIDQPIWVARKTAEPLALRLVAVKKDEQAAEAARRKVRREAQRKGYTPSKGTLEAAAWVIIVTSLAAQAFTTEAILALYRLRWRIELGFKRLKSIVGLAEPPGKDGRSAKPWLLAHLLMILLLEPLVDALEDSPPRASAA